MDAAANLLNGGYSDELLSDQLVKQLLSDSKTFIEKIDSSVEEFIIDSNYPRDSENR